MCEQLFHELDLIADLLNEEHFEPIFCDKLVKPFHKNSLDNSYTNRTESLTHLTEKHFYTCSKRCYICIIFILHCKKKLLV